MKALTVATAPPFCVDVGRITEHSGRFLLMKFAWLRQDHVRLSRALSCRALRSGKVRPGYRIGHTGQRLSDRIAGLVVPQPEVVDLDSADTDQDSQDFGSVALKASVGYRLAPPCSMNAK